MRFQAGDKIVFVGDSVTACGRRLPVGHGSAGELGTGYVSYIDAWLGATQPDQALQVINMGIDGNTVRDLAHRWQRDVVDLRPDWVSLMIGINEVWRQFDSPNDSSQHVDLTEYVATLEDLVAQTGNHVKGIIFMTPFLMESDMSDAMRSKTIQYARAMADIGRRYDIPVVHTQPAIDDVLAQSDRSRLSSDRVHPHAVGHMVLARAWIKTIVEG